MAESKTLIWDDPFSSVDLIFERKIMQALKKFPPKTIVLTSHRLSTVRTCQHIFLIGKERGLVNHGPTSEMLKPGTELYEHFKQQMV